MGCKVQSIWHIWTLLLLPFVKLQHFLHSSAGTQTITSGMFWSYLKFLITFFFIYYIFYIFFYCKTHSAAVYSLLARERFCSSPAPQRTGMEVLAPSRGVLPNLKAPPPSSPEEEEAEPRGQGQDTREAAARRAALQTLRSCFLHGVPKKVMWLSPGDESTFWDTGIRLHRVRTARLNQALKSSALLFFFSTARRKYECIY